MAGNPAYFSSGAIDGDRWSVVQDSIEISRRIRRALPLAELERDGSGRVFLVGFYKMHNVGNKGFFEETLKYLESSG